MIRALAFWTVFGAILLAAGCSNKDANRAAPGKAPPESPRLLQAIFIDPDGNGPDEGDILVLRFDREVLVQGSTIQGFVTSRDTDSFGDNPVLRQSVPGSDRVEITLGQDPVLSPAPVSPSGATKVNIAASGAGVIEVEGTNGFRAGRADESIILQDVTVSAPVFVGARFVDADNDGAIGQGDLVLASFNKPVSVPAGATVAENFTLPVSGDSFGASPSLSAASTLGNNRAVMITLGAGASLTLSGAFSPAATGAGSPSGLQVAASPTITDTLASSPNALSPGVAADLELPEITPLGNGRAAELALGTQDPFSRRLTAQGLNNVVGLDRFSGTLTFASTSFSVDLLFVADRGNDRVLIFADFPSGSFAEAMWVLGQQDFSTGTSNDPADPDTPAASGTNLSAPAGVAFDSSTNRLFVADTGHHRVLVFDDLFFVDPNSPALAMENGRSASFALGQSSLTEGRANRGQSAPSASSFSSPRGIHVDSGSLIVADTDNHRVLLFGSLPQSSSSLPSSVLGQADFSSGESNRGGSVAANTLSAPEDVFLSAAIVINSVTGAILVADSGNNRVLIFLTAAPASGAAANVALGQGSKTASGAGLSATALSSPAGVVADEGTQRLYVADRGNNRVMTYNAAVPIADGASGAAIGQASATAGSPNRGGSPAANTLSSPERVEIAGTALVVSDSGNHRILVYQGAALPSTDRAATLVLGQSSFTASSPGGRRVNQPSAALLVGGKLVLSDTANHRVLIYNSFPLTSDPDPDVVLGQADIFSTQANQGGSAGASTLNLPTYLATDGTRLAVADTGNHRVLIWATVPTTTGTAASVILGQSSASGALPNGGGAPGARTFHSPEGLAIAGDKLFVADRDNHRALIFDGFSALAGFDAADVVLGQTDFQKSAPNRGGAVARETLRGPRAVLVGAGRLYVADTGNHRVLVWDGIPPVSGKGADGLFGQPDFNAAARSAGGSETLLEPSGLAMDAEESFLLISDTGHHRLLFFDSVSGESSLGRNADSVLGQTSLFGDAQNAGLEAPTLATLESPRGIFFNGYELLLADAGNSRVLVFR
jgi:DNA-binding beta-propeller fold protein YncE